MSSSANPAETLLVSWNSLNTANMITPSCIYSPFLSYKRADEIQFRSKSNRVPGGVKRALSSSTCADFNPLERTRLGDALHTLSGLPVQCLLS